MSPKAERTPELLLEQLALGEIGKDDERWLREHLPAAELEQRLVALREADRAFHEARDPEQVTTAIEARLRTARARRAQETGRNKGLLYGLPALAAALCALLFVSVPAGRERLGSDGSSALSDDGVRIKGLAPHLVLHRRVGDQVSTLVDGSHAQRGDVLQVGYVAASARHGVIVSVDGAGTVTLHFPDAPTLPTRLETTGEQVLDHAYELDAAPAFERFFFVTSQTPMDPERVLDAARQLARTKGRAARAPLPLPASMTQQSLTLVKE